MIDLLYYIRNFKPDSPHHIAAFNELARQLPDEQLVRDAEWITIYNEEPTELNEPTK